MREKKQSKFKGYLLTIICGLVVIAGVLFLILQYRSDLKAMVSIYGSQTPEPGVATMWVIVIAALAGPVFLLCCWWLRRGIWILYTIRRAEAREKKIASQAVSKAKDELQAAAATAPQAGESTGDKGPPPSDAE